MNLNKKIYPINHLARIFRAMQGDKDAQAVIAIGDVEQFQHAETFSEFLKINELPVFEVILNEHHG